MYWLFKSNDAIWTSTIHPIVVCQKWEFTHLTWIQSLNMSHRFYIKITGERNSDFYKKILQKWFTQTGGQYVDHNYLFIITWRLPKYFNYTYRLDVYFVWIFRATLTVKFLHISYIVPIDKILAKQSFAMLWLSNLCEFHDVTSKFGL